MGLNGYLVCFFPGESVQHVFINCPFGIRTWMEICVDLQIHANKGTQYMDENLAAWVVKHKFHRMLWYLYARAFGFLEM